MADLKQLEQLYAKYGPYYSGKLILEASQLYKAGKFTEAAQKFADSRDGFEKKKNPTEWKILDDWREQAESKVSKSVAAAVVVAEVIATSNRKQQCLRNWCR